VVDEQHQPDDAALGDGGALVDIVDAEGKNGGSQQNKGYALCRKAAQRTADFLL